MNAAARDAVGTGRNLLIIVGFDEFVENTVKVFGCFSQLKLSQATFFLSFLIILPINPTFKCDHFKKDAIFICWFFRMVIRNQRCRG